MLALLLLLQSSGSGVTVEGKGSPTAEIPRLESSFAMSRPRAASRALLRESTRPAPWQHEANARLCDFAVPSSTKE